MSNNHIYITVNKTVENIQTRELVLVLCIILFLLYYAIGLLVRGRVDLQQFCTTYVCNIPCVCTAVQVRHTFVQAS